MPCENCNSNFGYIRLKVNKFICRKCGHESPVLNIKQKAKNFMGLSE